jgi:hypothetical protein
MRKQPAGRVVHDVRHVLRRRMRSAGINANAARRARDERQSRYPSYLRAVARDRYAP